MIHYNSTDIAYDSKFISENKKGKTSLMLHRDALSC